MEISGPVSSHLVYLHVQHKKKKKKRLAANLPEPIKQSIFHLPQESLRQRKSAVVCKATDRITE